MIGLYKVPIEVLTGFDPQCANAILSGIRFIVEADGLNYLEKIA